MTILNLFTLLHVLGEGNFGQVYEAVAKINSSNTRKVAVKILKSGGSISDYFNEAIAASKLKHENIVEFLGISLEKKSIILEFMDGGQLLNYLRTNKNDLTLLDLMNISHDIVKGCDYLERNKFVHRDLAARNCLLTSTDAESRTVK